MPLLKLREYRRPASVEEAAALLRRKSPRTAVLAGGTWLNGQSHTDVEAAVDIAGLGLNRLELSGAPARLHIGAAVTLQRLIDELPAAPGLEILPATAHAMAGMNIRNQATIGGSIATTDSSSPLATALLACNAELKLYTTEERTLSLSAFLSYRQSILADGALIKAVEITVPSPDTYSAYERVARTPSDYPIVCAAASCAIKDGVAGNVRVAIGGVAAFPIRLTHLELALEKKQVLSALDSALQDAIAPLTPLDDWLGSLAYRKEMARTLARRAIISAARLTDS